MAISLPWSTTLFGILTTLWLIALSTRIDLQQFLSDLLKRPASWVPVSFFCFAAVGTLWAVGVPWITRLHVAGTMVKLLAIPLLIYQFERSDKGIIVLLGFLASCTALTFISWLNWIDPRTIRDLTKPPGVPVKNYITQGTEFALCIFGGAGLAIIQWRQQHRLASFMLAALSAAFLLNMAFVVSSRTALVTLPLLLLISSLRYIGWYRSAILYLVVAVAAAVLWLSAPNFRMRIDSIHEQYIQRDVRVTSVGERLGYWSNAIKFFSRAPLVGHGTGSIRQQFEREGVSNEEVVANPHNQTLYFAIEWGAIGIVLLWAMWIVHFKLFTEIGWLSWLGLIIVSQNVIGSIFNSHISDFVEGWIYVMGVGIAAGMISKTRKTRSVPTPAT
jgi:hypothetical protein